MFLITHMLPFHLENGLQLAKSSSGMIKFSRSQPPEGSLCGALSRLKHVQGINSETMRQAHVLELPNAQHL